MKKISFKLENKGSGIASATDELWGKWKELNNGEFEENESQFIMRSTKNEEYVVEKKGELIVTKMSNRYLSVDLKSFEVYEGQNPTGGYFILYRFKDVNRRNEFVISTIMGMAVGSLISFVVA